MELTAKTKTGLEFTLKSRDLNGISWSTMMYFQHPALKETSAFISRVIVIEGQNTGIRFYSASKKQNILFSLDATTIETVKSHFADVDAVETTMKTAKDEASLTAAQAECPDGYVLAKYHASAGDSCLAQYKTLDGITLFASDQLEAHHGYYFVAEVLVVEKKGQLAKASAEKAVIEKKTEEKKAASFTEAKETGKPVILKSYSVECNDPKEECDCDNVIVYAMPDGTTKTERFHTW